MPKTKRDLARPLTPRQAAFVAAYLVCGIATQALVEAGYSPKSADSQASHVLRLPQVRAAIRAGESAKLDRTLLTAERVLEEHRRLAFSDIGHLFTTDGKLKPIRSLPAEIRSCISSVKVMKRNLIAGDGVAEDVIEIKLWDKNKALENLMKHFGLMVDLHADVTQKMIDSMDEGDIRTRIAQILAKIPPAQLAAIPQIVKENAVGPSAGTNR